MKRTKKPDRHKKRSLQKSKPGPPSGCTEEVIQEAHRLCLLGLTNSQLADHFGKDVTTIEHWCRTNPRFEQALYKGRKHAEGKAAKRLYELGMGLYEHERTKIVVDVEKEYDEDGNLIRETKTPRKVKYKEKLEPDRKALEKFLSVHNRETWGGAYKVEHKHSHLVAGGININTIMETVSDQQKFTDQELETIAKLGFQDQNKQITNGQ